jgi:hypothetical protein
MATNEMVERVARAIVEGRLRRRILPRVSDPAALAIAVNLYWVEFEDDAVEAIAAMRDPTRAMIAAAEWEDGAHTAMTVWRAMIDAATSQQPGAGGRSPSAVG